MRSVDFDVFIEGFSASRSLKWRLFLPEYFQNALQHLYLGLVGHKTALKSHDDDILQILFVESEGFACQEIFLGDGCVGYQPVVSV